MELLSLYQDVDQVLDRIQFQTLFPGFRRYGYALYTSREICRDGILSPYENAFRGNTSIYCDGAYIAIWNLELDPVRDAELLAYDLVHEMFHCHQNTLHESRFPSDLQLLQYPEDPKNYIRKYSENCWLADAYEHTDWAALQNFVAIREQRLHEHPDMVAQELRAETVEGMAEYIGLRALERISLEKFQTVVQQMLHRLRSEDRLQFDIRRISYYVGALFCLCLDRMGLEVRNEFDSNLSVYEQNRIPPAAFTTLRECPSLERVRTALAQEQQDLLNRHIADSEFTACPSRICGYDPMNMFRRGELLYCSHFVYLAAEGQVHSFDRAIVLVMKNGSTDEVIGYY